MLYVRFCLRLELFCRFRVKVGEKFRYAGEVIRHLAHLLS